MRRENPLNKESREKGEGRANFVFEQWREGQEGFGLR